MTDTPAKARDYSETLFLPKTDFPMRAGLPQKEPAILERWDSIGLYAVSYTHLDVYKRQP